MARLILFGEERLGKWEWSKGKLTAVQIYCLFVESLIFYQNSGDVWCFLHGEISDWPTLGNLYKYPKLNRWKCKLKSFVGMGNMKRDGWEMKRNEFNGIWKALGDEWLIDTFSMELIYLPLANTITPRRRRRVPSNLTNHLRISNSQSIFPLTPSIICSVCLSILICCS